MPTLQDELIQSYEDWKDYAAMRGFDMVDFETFAAQHYRLKYIEGKPIAYERKETK